MSSIIICKVLFSFIESAGLYRTCITTKKNTSHCHVYDFLEPSLLRLLFLRVPAFGRPASNQCGTTEEAWNAKTCPSRSNRHAPSRPTAFAHCPACPRLCVKRRWPVTTRCGPPRMAISSQRCTTRPVRFHTFNVAWFCAGHASWLSEGSETIRGICILFGAEPVPEVWTHKLWKN